MQNAKVTDRETNGRTDGRTYAHIESLRRAKNTPNLVLGFVGAKTISFSSQASSSSESPSPPYGLIRSLHICSKRYAGSLLGLNERKANKRYFDDLSTTTFAGLATQELSTKELPLAFSHGGSPEIHLLSSSSSSSSFASKPTFEL